MDGRSLRAETTYRKMQMRPNGSGVHCVKRHDLLRRTTRCTATAGALFTFDAFFFIDYFGCATPLPPPAVGELGLLGFAGTRSVFRCPFQRSAFAFFALAAFAAEPFPASPPRRPIAARYLETALILGRARGSSRPCRFGRVRLCQRAGIELSQRLRFCSIRPSWWRCRRRCFCFRLMRCSFSCL